MNKKIKIIDLLNKIANEEEVPQEIKINTRIFNFCDTCKTYEDEYERDLVIKWDELNKEVEILEDNTEEIEELDNWFIDEKKEYREFDIQAVNLCFKKHTDKINELVKAINELRKEKE